MADDQLAPSEDPFEQLASGATPAPEPAAAPAPPVANDNQPQDNPFAELGDVGPGPSSKTGAFARGAEKSVVPAAASLVGAGAGGAAVVGTAAALGTTVGPWGTLAGAIGGGLLAGYGGSYLQNLAVSHMPDTWRDKLGIDDRQARLDEAQHGTSSFLGGLLPFAVTMHPSMGPVAALPKNATAMQQIMAHPATSRVFGGALNGGIQIAQDEVSEGHLDWKKAAISTAFGVVFNRPNAIGEAITEAGAHPIRALTGTPHPTVAQVSDLNIMGPGVTEEVFQGTQERAPSAAMTAQEHARVEREALGEPPEADLHAVARQMEPELFAQYEDLTRRRDTFAAWHGEGPGHEMAEKHLAATEAEIREISPQVAAAYRRAEETMGPVTEEPEQFKSFAEMLAAREIGVPSSPTAPPPVPEGHIRFFHGEKGNRPDTGGGRWVTPHEQYARDWNTMPGETNAVHYVDIPKDKVIAHGGYDEINGYPRHFEAPEEIAKQLRPFGGKPGVQPGGEAPGIVPGAEPVAAAGVPVPQRTIGEQRAAIADDVARNLIAAGRSEGEARAAAQLVAARYVTRAGRFDGKLGTPEELYAREGAAIAGPAGKALEPASAKFRQVMADRVAGKIDDQQYIAAREEMHRARDNVEARQTAAEVQNHEEIAGLSPIREETQAGPEEVTHAEPVQAGIEAADRVNEMTPAQQKRELPKYTVGQPDKSGETILSGPKGVDQPAGVFMFDPTALNVDAKRFQFKSGGDEYGVTGALRNVTKWDPAKAQAIIVWEQADGKLFVADGHQRAGLARRLTEKNGAKGIELPGILYRERDGISADDIRAMAAVTNIANGSGSAVDGAKVLRARPDLMDGSLPLSVGKGKQAAALARLGDEPFKMVLNEVIPEHYGAVVGELIPNDPARQEAAVKAIARFEPKNADEAAVLTQRVAQAELAKAEAGAQGSMFGDLETAESTAGEEMKIVGRAIADLKKDRGLFSRVLANAERIEQTGSQIQREAAQSIASDAEVFAKTLTSDAYSAGPIRDELVAAARDLKNGKSSLADTSARIVAALREQVEAHGLNRSRDIGGTEPQAREYAQKDQLEFEPGAEGKPQSLVPGVAPVTQRDLIQAAASKSLKPRVAQKPAGGLFGDSMDQKELFQSAYHGSPYHFDMFDTGKIGTGEGAQSYGHGLYFAENEAVARDYQKSVIDKNWFDQTNARLSQLAREMEPEKIPGSYDKFKTERGRELKAEYDRLLQERAEKKGNLYRVNIKPEPQEFVQWEKSLRDQPKNVRDTLRKEFGATKDDHGTSFGDFFNHVERNMGISPQEISDILREAGVPGIRYLDQGSRSREVGGTHNYVVFDPKHIEILDRNGKSVSEQEYNQIARGKITIAPNKRPIIQLMKDANASTFVHESGHQYLEELMRDAAHGEAPEVLKADAKTVRDWLGVDSAEDIKTKHHEKFARGFEQYVREGVAPSKELAGVFAKFRDWLLSIYQSIKGLGTEISPDIRAVFDRLLEMEPQRTVVASERASPSLLHDIHESEAQHIPPHEAEPAMDRIMAEHTRYVTEQPPEIAREHEAAAVKIQETNAAANAAGESGAGAGGTSEVVGDRGAPGPEPAGGAGGAERGTVKPGGGGAGAEGAGAQRNESRSKLGDSAGTALAPGPTDLFGHESPYTDRAGNIRLDTLNTSEDVKQAIRASAAENNDFIGDRRGVVTDGQVMELADDIGMSGAENLVAQHVAGQAFNAEQVVALRKLLRESAANVSAAAKKFAASGSDADVLAFAQAKDRLQMVQKTVAGVTAEAGRALRAFRTLPGEQDTKALEQMVAEATGKTLFQLKNEAKLAAGIDTPQKMNKFMQNVDKRSLGGMVLEGWINGLLSGPSTQISNILSNAIFSVQHYGIEKAIAAVVGGALRAAGREGTYTRIGEVGAAAKGAVHGAAGATLAAGESFKKGATGLLPGEEEPASGILSGILHDDLLQRGTLDMNATVRDVQSAIFATSRGVRDAIVTGGALLKAGGVEGSPFMSTKYDVQGAIPDIQVRGVNVLPVGTVIRSTGRFLATADTFAASLNYSMGLNAIAYRMAADEGLAGSAFSQRVAQLRNDPTPEMMQAARGQAREQTFMDKGGEFVRAINNLTSRSVDLPVFGKTQPLKFIAPFTNVVSRILEQTIIKRTAVGAIFSKQLQADLLGKNGNIAQDTAAARMLIGSSIMLGFGALAAEGYVTGSGPKDQKENAIWKLTHQPHSVKIGSMWYQIQKLGPMGMLMGMAADLHDVAHIVEEGDFSKAGGMLFHAIVQNTLDQSSLQGPAELIKAVETPDQYGQQYIKSFLSSFVPNNLNWIERSRDPYIRQTWGVIDAIKAKIPGYGETLHPKIDLWGEPVPSREQLGGMTGIYTQKAAMDPVNKAMADLGMGKAMVPKKVRNVELTPDQYEFFARTAGRMAKMRLDMIVKSPQWETFPAYMKMKVINETIDGSRTSAEGLVFGKWPSILKQSRDDKMTLIKTGKKAIH